MKIKVAFLTVFFVFSFAFPLINLNNNADTMIMAPASVKEIKGENNFFRIKFTDGEKIEKISAQDYIIGVIAGEISPLSSPEALKAQAVAAYTFALYRKAKAADHDYDLTDSPKTDQCYVSPQKAKEKWGEKYDEYNSLIKSAVKEVYGQKITYNGDIILAAYHAISAGATDSAKDVWGSDIPYLVSVQSMGDKLSKNYVSSVSFTEEELTEKMKTLSSDTAQGNRFSDISASQNGLVISINYCGKKYKAEEIRKALSLASCHFTLEYKDGTYYFTTLGYGHGVGMSQCGAEYMAKQGLDYKQILTHYYKNCKVE